MNELGSRDTAPLACQAEENGCLGLGPTQKSIFSLGWIKVCSYSMVPFLNGIMNYCDYNTVYLVV